MNIHIELCFDFKDFIFNLVRKSSSFFKLQVTQIDTNTCMDMKKIKEKNLCRDFYFVGYFCISKQEEYILYSSKHL